MLLFNKTIGTSIKNESFSHIVDDHGNHFIARDDLYQRIRIDKDVDEDIFPMVGKLDPEWNDNGTEGYSILQETRWVNNNKNMNPLLLVDNDAVNHGEQVVFYLTVSLADYTIVRYRTNHRILQTYHKKDVFQGCAIVFNLDSCSSENNTVIELQLFNKATKKYEQFNIKINDYLESVDEAFTITDRKAINAIKEYRNKTKHRVIGFKIIVKPHELLTNTYITTEGKLEEVKELTKDIKNVNIITVDDEFADGNTPSSNKVSLTKNKLESVLKENRIRAVTIVGINLPKDITRELRLLYVFKYNQEKHTLISKKSN